MTWRLPRATFDPHGAWVERSVDLGSGEAVLEDLPPQIELRQVQLVSGSARLRLEDRRSRDEAHAWTEERRRLEDEERSEGRLRDLMERMLDLYRVRMGEAWMEADPGPDAIEAWLDPLMATSERMARRRRERREAMAELTQRIERWAGQREPQRLHLIGAAGAQVRVRYREPRAGAKFGLQARLEESGLGTRLRLERTARLWQQTESAWHVDTVRYSRAVPPEDLPRFTSIQVAAQRGSPSWTWLEGPKMVGGLGGLHTDVTLPAGPVGWTTTLESTSVTGRVGLEWWPESGHQAHRVFRGALPESWQGTAKVFEDGAYVGEREVELDALTLGPEPAVHAIATTERQGREASHVMLHTRLQVTNRSPVPVTLTCWRSAADAQVVSAAPQLEPDESGRWIQRLVLPGRGEVTATMVLRVREPQPEGTLR